MVSKSLDRGSLAACTSGRFCLPKRVDSWWQPVPSVEGSRGRSESPKSGRKPVVKNRSFFSEGSGWVPPAPGPCRVFVEKIDQGARKIENQVFRSKLGRNLPYFRQKIGQFSSKLPLQNSKSGENRGFCPLESIFRPEIDGKRVVFGKSMPELSEESLFSAFRALGHQNQRKSMEKSILAWFGQANLENPQKARFWRVVFRFGGQKSILEGKNPVFRLRKRKKHESGPRNSSVAFPK